MDTATLDATFLAVADPTRRAILARLAQGEASVAEPFGMSQPAISKHLRGAHPAPAATRSARRRRTHAHKETMMTTTAHQAEVTLPSDREVKVTRSFNAPRALVYRAHTEPALLKRWMLGPPGWTMPVCEMDLRVGGKYRWRWRSDEDGKEFGFHGEFREVQPGVKTVHTETYDPGTMGGEHSGGEALITTRFEEKDGVTTVITLMDFGSEESRDKAMATGMTGGMEQSFQLLDSLLAELGRS